MGKKFKNNKKKQNNNNNGYFAQNVQKYGENFHEKKNAEELKKDAPRIFKDIAFLNGRVSGIIEYFMSEQFVNNLKYVADDLYRYNNAVCIGLTTYYQQQTNSGQYSQDERIPEILNDETKRTTAYGIIMTGLTNISNELNSLHAGKDRLSVYYAIGNHLKSMSINLRNYRFIIS